MQSYPQVILEYDVEAYRRDVNKVLKQVCSIRRKAVHRNKKECPKVILGKSYKGQDMDGMDVSTKLLLGTDFSDCTCYGNGTIFLGVDTRGTNSCNADMSEALFLTQE